MLNNPYLRFFKWIHKRYDQGIPAYKDDFCFMPWRWRRTAVSKYAWAVPDDWAIQVIEEQLNGMGVVEIGAGTGYWAWMLSQVGIDVAAYDTKIKRRKLWYPVKRGGAKQAKRFPDRALMLCWPWYGEPMATNCLLNYSGNTLIYIGEGYGGCTADDEFHRLIGEGGHYEENGEWVSDDSEWSLVVEEPIPQWDGIHDKLSIYRR
jgi:hypothetical protein